MSTAISAVFSRTRGLLVVGAIAATAAALSATAVALDSSSIAIVLGILCASLGLSHPMLRPGIRFSTRVILPFGIVLLGSRLALADLMSVGLTGLLLSLLGITTCAVVIALLIRWFSLPLKLTALVGVGTAICGGSAIAATAPVIDAEDDDIAWSITTVALLGLIAMFALPVIGHWLGVGTTAFGIWAGLTIQQTPQVIAAGLAYGGDAAEVATLIKLVRVSLLAPVVFVVGALYARSQACERHGGLCWSKALPPFVLGFFAMATLRSVGWLELTIPDTLSGASLLDLSTWGSKAAQAMAMAAIGLETRLSTFKKSGLQPLFAGAVAALVVTTVAYLAIEAGSIGS